MKVNLNPFHVYVSLGKNILKGYKKTGFSGVLKSLDNKKFRVTEILLNIILFIPFGYLIPLSKKDFHRWWTVVLLGLLFSFIVETIQLITHLGYFDTADLMNNSIGALIGYCIFLRWLRDRTPESALKET